MKRSFLIAVIYISIAVLGVLVVVALMINSNNKPVFHDVTVEAGYDSLSIWDFLTDPPQHEGSSFVTDVDTIDLNTPGIVPVTLQHGRKTYIVTLTIRDTTAPKVDFKSEYTLLHGAELDPKDFVEFVDDLSPVTVQFVSEPDNKGTYSDLPVEIIVTDLYGNSTVGTSVLRYDWLISQVDLELGTPLTKEHVLVNAQQDGDLIDQKVIDEINTSGAGQYTLTVQSGESVRSCSVTIHDTTPPELVLKQVSILPTQQCTLEDFIEKAYDISGDVNLELLTELPFGQEGNHTISIKATDKNGLSFTAETTLRIHEDIIPPKIFGMTDITVVANSGKTPNYRKNVTARDAKDGYIDVFYDDSEVDLNTPGVYYVYYTAYDKTGNVAVRQRQVTVLAEEN